MKNKQSIDSLHLNWENGEPSTKYVIPSVIGASGGGIKEAINEVKKKFRQDDLRKKIVGQTQRIKLMGTETIIRKILSGHVQTNFL